MRVMYVNKRSALFSLLFLLFILLAGYSLIANFNSTPRKTATAAPTSDRPAKEEQQPNLLPTSPVLPDVTGQAFFVDCRLARDRIRSQQMETLKEIASQSESSKEVRDSAQRSLMQLAENMSRETELEKLVMARGYQDAAVMILPGSATVVVQTPSVTPAAMEQIKTLVVKATDLVAANVFVIPKP
ncbi:MAG: SpoIIIAH-like family protein [Thermacetogeniaceae bacterium]